MKNTTGSLPLPVLWRSQPLPTDTGLAYRMNLQARAQAWADLDLAQMRRRAVEAARDMDEAGLWSLTEAHLLLNGLAGAKVSAHTIRAYRKSVRTFLEYAREAGVQLLRPRPHHGAAFVRWLESKGLNTSTVRVGLAAGRKLFVAIRWAGATDATPSADVRPAPDPVARTEERRPYTTSEIDTLVRVGDLEEKVIVLPGAHAGLRVSEIAGLQRADLHLETSPPYLTVVGKRQKRQSVLLSRSLHLALMRWLAATPTLGPRVLSGGNSDYV